MARRGTLFIVLILVLVSFRAGASSFDPSKNWKTIKTVHFALRFPEDLTSVAQDAARIFEEVHAKLSPKLKWKPLGKTQIIITDSTDDSNGLTMVLPYNWMILYVVQPRPDSTLADYDNWLRTLIIHEYTHVLTLDANRGFWKPFRLLLGKTVAPYGVTPQWVREGVAVYEETKQTKGGRNRASMTDMIIRAATLEDDFPTIDEADGFGWKWPSYNTAYLFGGKFIEYLVDTYGEDKFIEFDRRVESSPLLSMVNHQARNVYHKTFYELWREWKAKLKEDYAAVETKLKEEGLTETKPVVTPTWDEQFSAPAPSPDGKMLAYIAASPHRKTEVRVKELETGEVWVIAKQDAESIAWSPDGTKLVYSAEGSYKRYNRYFDLWLYDFETNKKKKLTSGKRARDPDFDPTGSEVVFVSGTAGTDTIRRINVGTKEEVSVTEPSPEYIHFANPKFSPDGNTVAVDVHKDGGGWDIYLYSLGGDWKKRLTNEAGMETSPFWSKDGRYIYYSSDKTGITNVYRAEVESGDSTRVTNVVNGVFEPVSADGQKFYVREYNSKGFVISSFDVPPHPVPPPRGGRVKEGVTKDRHVARDASLQAPRDDDSDVSMVEESQPYPVKRYNPFGQAFLLPRYIMPTVVYLQDAFVLGGETGASDPLHWHNWRAGLNYRTDAEHIQYYGYYYYNRWLPVLGFGINDYAVDMGDLSFRYPDGSTQAVHYYEQRRNLSAALYLPIKKSTLNLSYFYEDRMPITSLTQPQKDVLNLGIFSGFMGNWIYNDTEAYPASISPENGRVIRLTGIITDQALGSGDRNEQRIFSGDWREYIRLWHHHVLALRTGGGIQWGDRQVQGTFGLGGAIGEGTFASGMSYNYFPLRGLPVSALSRNRAMLMSAEYRVPLVSPQRGIGTWPFYLKNLHAAFFADYGNAWNADQNEGSGIHFFDEFMLGVGTELRGDFMLGHGLPLTARLGYGIIVVNRDRIGSLTDPLLGTSLDYGTLILQFGTSF